VDPLLPRLFEKEYRDLEGSIKLRNYSGKTFAAYRLWVGKFQAFVHSRPTDQLAVDEVRGFLTELAVRHGVAASTQNQAFNALLFFFRHVLRREFGQLDGVVRAKRHRYVPVVLSHLQTIQKLLGHSDIRTTMIYLQTVPSLTLKEAKSPLDLGLSLAPPRSQDQVKP
jgi:site-specific recombinase XerD